MEQKGFFPSYKFGKYRRKEEPHFLVMVLKGDVEKYIGLFLRRNIKCKYGPQSNSLLVLTRLYFYYNPILLFIKRTLFI